MRFGSFQCANRIVRAPQEYQAAAFDQCCGVRNQHDTEPPRSSPVLTQLLILLLSSALRLGSAGGAASLWSQAALLPMSSMLLYHLVAVHSLWYAPFYGWLLLVSAWARRATFLWAFLPPLAIVILERIVFNTSHFADMLHRRFVGGMEAAVSVPGSIPIDPGMHITLGRYLSTPGLWFGILLTAVFLTAAVQLRRYREAL